MTKHGKKSAVAAVLAAVVGLVAPGCASVLGTAAAPSPFVGTVMDASLITQPAAAPLALVDFVPTVTLDTALLPYTAYCALDGTGKHGVIGELRFGP